MRKIGLSKRVFGKATEIIFVFYRRNYDEKSQAARKSSFGVAETVLRTYYSIAVQWQWVVNAKDDRIAENVLDDVEEDRGRRLKDSSSLLRTWVIPEEE